MPGEDQRAAGQAANRQLAVDDARLDRFAEPDFVGEIARPPMCRSTRWATSIWCGSSLMACRPA